MFLATLLSKRTKKGSTALILDILPGKLLKWPLCEVRQSLLYQVNTYMS